MISRELRTFAVLTLLVGAFVGNVGRVGAAEPTHAQKMKAARAKSAAATRAKVATKPAAAMQLAAAPPAWMKVDASAKSVAFEIKMAENGNNGTFNFNGYGRGAMTITVPVGWDVKMHVINIGQGAIPHSLEVIPVTEVVPREGVDPPAFGGAETINLVQGMNPGGVDDANFKAETAGKFWIFCGVPNHGTGGMYDFFTVSSTATAPSVTFASPK